MRYRYICKGPIYVFASKNSFIQDVRHNNIMTCWSQPIPTMKLDTESILRGLRYVFSAD